MSHDTEEARFLIYYRHCGTEWEDIWSCACDSECPVCGADIKPYDYEDLATLRHREPAAHKPMVGILLGRLKAFYRGVIEFRSDCTTHLGIDLIETYDSGREFIHRLTFRYFDNSSIKRTPS